MTLSHAQEAVAAELRRILLLPLDHLAAVTREFIKPNVSRSGMDPCLRRHGVSILKALIPSIVGREALKKAFKDYKPGFLHVDFKYLPKILDATRRRYLFVAIDRATRWIYMSM